MIFFGIASINRRIFPCSGSFSFVYAVSTAARIILIWLGGFA